MKNIVAITLVLLHSSNDHIPAHPIFETNGSVISKAKGKNTKIIANCQVNFLGVTKAPYSIMSSSTFYWTPIFAEPWKLRLRKWYIYCLSARNADKRGRHWGQFPFQDKTISVEWWLEQMFILERSYKRERAVKNPNESGTVFATSQQVRKSLEQFQACLNASWTEVVETLEVSI